MGLIMRVVMPRVQGRVHGRVVLADSAGAWAAWRCASEEEGATSYVVVDARGVGGRRSAAAAVLVPNQSKRASNAVLADARRRADSLTGTRW